MRAAHERYLIFERRVYLLSPSTFAYETEITCLGVGLSRPARPVGLPDSAWNARDRVGKDPPVPSAPLVE